MIANWFREKTSPLGHYIVVGRVARISGLITKVALIAIIFCYQRKFCLAKYFLLIYELIHIWNIKLVVITYLRILLLGESLILELSCM